MVLFCILKFVFVFVKVEMDCKLVYVYFIIYFLWVDVGDVSKEWDVFLIEKICGKVVFKFLGNWFRILWFGN